MDFIGINVHKRESQVCILAAEGEVVEKRIRTERGRFAELLGGRPRARIRAYKPAHRTSDSSRHLRAQLAVREALVRTRARYISLMRALVQQFLDRVERLQVGLDIG